MTLLLKLILAHLIGDFLLQPPSWVASKAQRKAASLWLYVHIALHALLVLAFCWNEPHVLYYTLGVLVIHLVIDLLKLYLQKPRTKTFWFFLDQMLHIISLVLLWYFIAHPQLPSSLNIPEHWWAYAIGFVFITTPASILIQQIMKRWAPYTEEQESESLKNAGAFIGILERFFVLAFVLAGHWEAIGFLLATKSIFRFGDLKEAKDRKLTEYILIGTLLSFGFAILSGVWIHYYTL